MNEKARLRQELRARRKALDPATRAAAHEAMSRSLEALLPAGPVALYAGTRDEADATLALVPDPLWPRVVGVALELVRCPRAELVPGYRGILEPPPTLAPVPLAEVAAIVVPGVAFDARGHRLGQGGGHYDRLIARARELAAPPLVVALAYDFQIVSRVPDEAHDQRVDRVVTERRVLETSLDGADGA